MEQNNETMVSVGMITYNHEPYIAQAIEGVLAQKTNFSFELIIGEDCSTDNTAAIIKEYAQKYPDILKARYNISNLGVMVNAVETMQQCTGKYMAFCEGDDYWTDQYKLQKQVDFLEANEDYSLCFNETDFLYGDILKSDQYQKMIPEESDILQLAQGNYIYTNTAVFRKSAVNNLPQKIFESYAGDYFLFLLICQHGKIKKIPEVMGVYRIHENGIWSKLSENNQCEKHLEIFQLIMDYFKENVQVYDRLKIQYINICLHLIENYKSVDEKKKEEILFLLNKIEPGYFYAKFAEINERYENLRGSSKKLIRLLVKKQLNHIKRVLK